jgi:prevent-host-death family protein
MAKTTRVSITEAKQHLGELVKRAAYGGETIVLEFRGKPQAAIVAYEEAEALSVGKKPLGEALDDLSRFRETMKEKYGTLPDSAAEIREMREERAQHLGDL